MKIFFYFLLILVSINSYAQDARAFAGISGYLDTEFKRSAFVEVGGGLEVKTNRFFKPEIGISYFIGDLNESINKDEQGNATDFTDYRVSAVNFNLTPKICLGNAEFAGDITFQILPRYNISKVQAERTYTLINQSNPSTSVTTKETLSEWQHSLGIGLGIDFVLSDKNYDSFSVNLYYNGVNMGKPLTKLINSNTKYDTTTLGLGMSYYFGFKKKKNQD